jgi:hypothetical protein
MIPEEVLEYDTHEELHRYKKNHKKQQGASSNSNNSNSVAATIQSLKKSSSTSSEPMMDQHIIVDKEAFHKWSRDFRGLLKPNDLQEIWQQVQRDHWGDNLNVTEKIEIATIYASQRIDMLLDDTPMDMNPTVSAGNHGKYNPHEKASGSFVGKGESSPLASATLGPPIDETDYLVSFKRLFVDIIPNDQLELIWKSIKTEEITLEEKEELAVLYAMEYLETKQLEELEDANNLHLLEILSIQEAQRLEQQEQAAQKLHWKDFAKHEKAQSTQEVALQMVCEVFKDSNLQNVSTQRISEILIKCQYDVEEAISTICQEALRDGHYTRQDTTFANVVKTETTSSSSGKTATNKSVETSSKKGTNKKEVANGKAIPGNNKMPAASSSAKLPNGSGKMPANNQKKSTTTVASSAAITDIQPTKQPNLLFRTRLKVDPTHQYRFGLHFLSVVKAKNPLIEVELSHDGELVYTGMKSNYGQRKYDNQAYQNVLMIMIDLHGLPVVQALQIVDSSIDYYRDSYDARKENIERVTVRYIVGKGIHSAGGIAKIKPAVLSLLSDRNETNFVLYEGEIILSIGLV